MRAAGLNPVDLKMAGDARLAVPRVVGNEAVIEHRRARAYAERTISPHGSVAEYAVVDRRMLDPLPDDVTDADALAIGIPGIAAWISLVNVAALQPRETVVIVGATGPVGRLAVQIAQIRGARRIVALGRDATRLERLTSVGATHLVPLGSGDDAAQVAAACGDGADVVLDLVYGAPLVAALAASKQGARIVCAGASGGQEAVIPFAALRGRTVFTHSNQMTENAPKRVAYRRLLSLLRRRHLSVDPVVVPCAEAERAWQLQATTTGSKIVLAGEWDASQPGTQQEITS